MRKKLLDASAIALFACLVLGFGLAVWSASQQQPHRIEDRAKHNPNAKSLEIVRSESVDERIARYNFWLTIMTGVLAISTLALWIETRLAGRRQSRDMKASIDLARDEFIS